MKVDERRVYTLAGMLRIDQGAREEAGTAPPEQTY